MQPTAHPRVYIDLKSQPITNSNKEKLLNTAIDLFSNKGFNAVSVRDITRGVGIKESSLYNHFKSKDEILETIFWNFRMETAKIMPPVDQLETIFTFMGPKEFLEEGLKNFKNHISDPVIEKIWLIIFLEQYRNSIARDIYLHDIVEKTLHFIEFAFSKFISLGQIKPLNPKLLAMEYQYPLFKMIEIYIMLRIDDKETESIERSMNEYIEFFCEANIIKKG